MVAILCQRRRRSKQKSQSRVPFTDIFFTSSISGTLIKGLKKETLVINFSREYFFPLYGNLMILYEPFGILRDLISRSFMPLCSCNNNKREKKRKILLRQRHSFYCYCIFFSSWNQTLLFCDITACCFVHGRI